MSATTECVCTAAEFDQFWTDTLGAWAKHVYLADGGPTEKQWIAAEHDPDTLFTFTYGWFGWQGTDDCPDIDRIDDREARQRIMRILDDSDLADMFTLWRKTNTGALVGRTVHVPVDKIAALEAWLTNNGGTLS